VRVIYHRDLVTAFSVLLAFLGSFLIYDSLTNPLDSEGFDIILGACCCSLALILLASLVFHSRDPAQPKHQERE
jgi:hypothetical protein